jgi:hypothetical protein
MVRFALSEIFGEDSFNGSNQDSIATARLSAVGFSSSKNGCSNTRSKTHNKADKSQVTSSHPDKKRVPPLAGTYYDADGNPHIDPSFRSFNHPASLLQSGSQLEIGIHWITFDGVFPSFDLLEECLYETYTKYDNPEVIFKPGHPLRLAPGVVYANSGFTLDGGKFGYESRTNENGVTTWHLHICINGTMLERFDTIQNWAILTVLAENYRLECSRIDVKVRDYSRRVVPAQILDWAHRGYVRGVRKAGTKDEFEIGDPGQPTAYLGSKGNSLSYVRVYDSMPVRRVNAIDWEAEFRRGKAKQVFQTLLLFVDKSLKSSEDICQEILQYLGAIVLGMVDFIDESEAPRKPGDTSRVKELSRCKLQQWWVEFKQEISYTLRVSAPRTPRTVEKTIRWFGKQIAPTIAMFGQMFEDFDSWLHLHQCKARERFNDTHLALMASVPSGSSAFEYDDFLASLLFSDNM